MAFDKFLFYGTAGVAFGQTSADEVVSRDITARESAEEDHIGWTAGAGAEWMYAENWSLKTEYLYTDLGSADYRFVGTTFVGDPHTTDSSPADLYSAPFA